MAKCVSCGVSETAEGYGAYCADCDGLNGPVPLLDEDGKLVSPRTKENPMEAQYRAHVSKWDDEYAEDRDATLAAAMKYQPDMEMFELALEEATEWLCSFRGDEPEHVAAEMFVAAIKAAVEAKASGARHPCEIISDACNAVFDNSLREVRDGKRALVAYEDTI